MAIVWVARTSLTWLVPIPKAIDPKAPWVEVWESPQAIVIPGWVTQFWSYYMNYSLISTTNIKKSYFMLYAVLFKCFNHLLSKIIFERPALIICWHNMINCSDSSTWEFTFRFLSFKAPNAWGLVTSWIRWRPIKIWSEPPGRLETLCKSQTLSNNVFGSICKKSYLLFDNRINLRLFKQTFTLSVWISILFRVS